MASDAGSDTPWTMVDDDASLVGGATTQNHAADQYVWLRGAIAFVDVGVDEYGHLARKIGSRAAAEVILLAVCRVCGDDVSKWNRAKKLGIPWQQKKWTAITELQTKYNTAVARKVMPSVAEDLTTLGVDTPGFGGLSAAASSVGGSASAIMAADPAGQSMVGGEDQQSMVGGAAAAASSMVGCAAAAAAAPAASPLVGCAAAAAAAPAASPPPPCTQPYAPKPGLGFTPPVPAHSVPAPFGVNDVSCPAGSDEWPKPAQAGTVRKVAAKWRTHGRTEQHFTQEVFHKHGMAITHPNALCKFTDRPKYEVHLQRPNDFDLDEVA